MGDRLIRPGQGTAESEWLNGLASRDVRAITLDELVPVHGRAVVVAPHPDDEVLAVGGLMALVASARRALCVVAVTDGEASHPGSEAWPPERLAQERPREQARALARLGGGASELSIHRLGFPDGGLQALQSDIAESLSGLIRAHDVLFTPWRLDGHPDHEAVGHACATAAQQCGARLVEVPVWGWHWARPQEPCWPWPRARQLLLGADATRRKQAAVAAFRSQIEADRSTGALPVLGPGTLARARRPFEILFV